MTQQPSLNIPDITQVGWTQQLIDLFPLPWTGDAAKVTGGILYALMSANAANLEVINQDLIYGFDASRIATATNGELDLVSQDFFGNTLPRQPGESDTSFRMRIQTSLFLPYVTRPGFAIILTRATGQAPRLIEPWNTGDTGGYDWSCYDADYPTNPSLYGDAELRYQAAVIAVLPPYSDEGQSPIWMYDAGAAYDIYTGVYWPTSSSLFTNDNNLDQLIERIKAFGVTIWRKYLISALVNWIIAQSFSIANAQYSFSLTVQPFVGPYFIFTSGSWNSTFYAYITTPSGFTIQTGTPSVSTQTLNYAAIPFNIAGVGSVPLNGGSGSVIVNVPASAPTNRVIVTPNWNTTVYISALSPSSITFSFGAAAPIGGVLNYYFMPNSQSALVYVPSGSNSIFIPLTPSQISVPFVTPSWNTQVAVTLISGGIQATFDVAAPSDAFVQWGLITII